MLMRTASDVRRQYVRIVRGYFPALTPHTMKYEKYTDESFPTPEAFQEFLRAGKTLTYDYVIVAGVLFTMEEYDMDGKTVIWANKKHEKTMSVDTSNRYGPLGYTDATVSLYPSYGFRNDVTYAE